VDVARPELPAALPVHRLWLPGVQRLDALQVGLQSGGCAVARVRDVRTVPAPLRGQHGHHAVGGAREDPRAGQGAVPPPEHGQVDEAAQGDEGERSRRLELCQPVSPSQPVEGALLAGKISIVENQTKTYSVKQKTEAH